MNEEQTIKECEIQDYSFEEKTSTCIIVNGEYRRVPHPDSNGWFRFHRISWHPEDDGFENKIPFVFDYKRRYGTWGLFLVHDIQSEHGQNENIALDSVALNTIMAVLTRKGQELAHNEETSETFNKFKEDLREGKEIK